MHAHTHTCTTHTHTHTHHLHNLWTDCKTCISFKNWLSSASGTALDRTLPCMSWRYWWLESAAGKCATVKNLPNVSSVQISSRWYPCTWKSPKLRTPQCLCNSSSVCLNDDGHLYHFKADHQVLLIPNLSPPCSQWCDVLGFVSAGSVSSSSTLSERQATCDG